MECLHLQSDGEYGTYVYYQHYDYRVISYFTDDEDLLDIINELIKRIDNLKNDGLSR